MTLAWFTLAPDDGPAREAFELVPRSYDEAVRWALVERAADGDGA